jgi:hypothetical protein
MLKLVPSPSQIRNAIDEGTVRASNAFKLQKTANPKFSSMMLIFCATSRFPRTCSALARA